MCVSLKSRLAHCLFSLWQTTVGKLLINSAVGMSIKKNICRFVATTSRKLLFRESFVEMVCGKWS